MIDESIIAMEPSSGSLSEGLENVVRVVEPLVNFDPEEVVKVETLGGAGVEDLLFTTSFLFLIGSSFWQNKLIN